MNDLSPDGFDGRKPSLGASEKEGESGRIQKDRRFALFVFIVVLASASVLYRFLVTQHIEQSAAMFIGIPALMAVGLTFVPKGTKVTGAIMWNMTFFLLLLGVLLVEGFICILMAAPFFYAIGFVVGILIDGARARKQLRESQMKIRCSLVLIFGLMSLEGVVDNWNFNRSEIIRVDALVRGSLEDVRLQSELGPQFSRDRLPLYLRLGFPFPAQVEGEGMAVGDEWKVYFEGGEGSPGDLIVRVTESTSDSLVCECVSDESHIAHWLDWREVRWDFSEGREGDTIVKMTMSYERLLDPAWYFGPAERYGVRKAGEYFLKSVYEGALIE